MGMRETRALTAAEWCDPTQLLDMPENDHYRFGAHVSDKVLVDAYRNQDKIYGVYITRDAKEQARSLRAYLAVYRAQNISEGCAMRGTLDNIRDNSVWADQPNVLPVRFEDLIAGKGWQEISDHLGGAKVDTEAIMRRIPPKKGELYYRNTRSTPIYYDGAKA